MTEGWPEAVYDVLVEANVRQVGYVPDSGLSRLIARCHAGASTQAVALTTEEEGVAMLAGAWLGGVFFESTGSYNTIWWIGVLLGVIAAALHFPIDDKPVERAQPAGA